MSTMSGHRGNAYKNYRNRTNLISLIAIISLLSMLVWGVARTINVVQFKMNCEQYIKRAADASSIDIAKGEIEKVLNYCENNGLTEGVVSIFFKQPKNDVGFWYQNLKTAHQEMSNLPEDTSTLEETNLLMKIRETLVDTDEYGAEPTVPDGISIYPYNQLYFWWFAISLAAFIFVSCCDKRF